MIHFESPWAFLLLIIIPALPLIRRFTIRKGAVTFSSTKNAARAGRSLRQRLHKLPTFIRLLALVCLVIALARPQTGREQIVDISKGVAIEMVLDRSGSMAGEKLKQAKRALLYCINNLNPDDGFEIIRFSTEAYSLFDKIVKANESNIDDFVCVID